MSAVETSTTPTWDVQITKLLSELSQVQTDLLALLTRKRDLIAQRDTGQLSALEPEEEQLSTRLTECHQKRQQLLASAAADGLPSDSLRSLTASLPRQQREQLTPDVEAARQRARLVQHHSLTNWVLVQRSLLHLSQMIEIIATGGHSKPTYGDQTSARAGGALVDQAV